MSGRTTQFARTMATLRGVLTGLWPDASVPSAFTTASDQGELLYGNVGSCARLKQVFKLQMAETRGALKLHGSLLSDPKAQH